MEKQLLQLGFIKNRTGYYHEEYNLFISEKEDGLYLYYFIEDNESEIVEYKIESIKQVEEELKKVEKLCSENYKNL